MLPYPRESTEEMLNLCRLLGQELFDPPNVKGWTGGEHWISTQTLLVRNAYLSKLSRGDLNENGCFAAESCPMRPMSNWSNGCCRSNR